MISTEKMGRCQIVVFFFAFLLALFVSAQLCTSDPQKEAPAASSFLKGWNDWAQGKMGSYGKKVEGETKGAASAAGGWSNWASDKISSFSGRASKDAAKATQAGKEKVKAEGEAAAKEGQDILKGAEGGAKEGSEKAKEYAGMAKEGIDHQDDETHKLKEDAEL